MTKQVDILLGETKGIEKKSTANSSNTPKKEGASFFDNILADAKAKSTTAEKVTTKETPSKEVVPTDNKTSKVDSAKETVKTSENVKESTTSDKTVTSNKENTNTTVQKEEKQTSEIKQQSPSSLLDRMLVEAKTMMKDENAKVVKEDKKNEKDDEKTVNKKNSNKNIIQEANKSGKTAESVENTVSNTNKENNKGIEEQTTSEKTELSKMDKADLKEDSKEAKLDKSSLIEKTKVVSKEENSNQNTNQVKEAENKGSVLKENVIQKNETLDAKNIVETIQTEKKDGTLNQNIEQKETPIKVVVNGNAESKTKDVQVNNTVKEVTTSEVKENRVNTSQQDKNSLVKNDDASILPKTNESLTNTKESKTAQTVDFKSDSEKQRIVDKKVDTNVENKTNNQNTAEVKNQKVASELAKLNTQESKETVNISKDSVLNNQVHEEKTEKISLLDKLINDTKAKMANTNNNANESSIVAKEQKVEKLLNNDVLANIYLSTRAKNIEQKNIETHHKGKQQILNAKNIADVKQGAETLEMGLKEASVEVKQATTTTSQTSDILDRNLQRLAFAKNHINDDISQLDIYSKKISKEASKAVLGETVVNLQVNAQNVQNITQKIIGARQQMASMMSDIAREMYSNYKPPVTALRLNLQPAHLGSIAIMIKSDRENTISISMNMSNSATLDAISDNQGTLRSALNKTFGEQNSFNLDLGMQDDNKNGAQDQNSQNNQNKQQPQRTSTEGLLEAREENKEEMLMNYM